MIPPAPDEASQPVPIALALSGGGFRASIFHLGVLRRLAELGLLPKITVISTVSGGTIIGAFAALRWQQVLTDGGDWPALDRHVCTPFLQAITTRNFLLSWLGKLPRTILTRTRDATFSRTAAAADLYDDWFFQGATLDELPPTPRLVMNATSLPSIRAWRFTHDGMGDSRYGYTQWTPGTLAPRVSIAVSASAAFPPVFTPVRIRLDEHTFTPPAYRQAPTEPTKEMLVSDGGVYDNLGLEVLLGNKPLPNGTLLPPPGWLIVSDAGHPARYRFTGSRIPGIGAFTLLSRVRDIALEQVGALRQRALIDDFQRKTRKGLLVAIKSSTATLEEPARSTYRSAVGEQTQIPPALLAVIQTIRTSLDRFSPTEAEALQYHAYTMTDAFWWAYLARPQPAPDPSWRINFDADTVTAWGRELMHSNQTLRLR
ncbi:MAG: patatin-like phospholipase family protein [Acidobacteriota bacterium]|nr:patatin-like phospholipase family protein [Acidobacteriota bacterium]